MDLGVELCRFCMAKDNLRSIIQTCDGLTMEFEAEYCNLINIDKDDDLPGYACKVCKFKIHFFYEFKLQCEMTKLKLKELISEIKVKQEMEDNKDSLEVKCEFDDIVDYDSAIPREDVEKSFVDKIKLEKYHRNNIKKVRSSKKRFKTKNAQFEGSVKVLKSNLVKMPKSNRVNTELCDARPFQCELCGQTFKLKSVLKKHLVTHTSEKLFGCPICPKRYTREEHRVVHMRMHAGYKPFVCEICARSFTKNQDLIRHKKIHSDEKNYSCSWCDKRFKRSGDVHTHMRTHTGLKPFKCLECSKSYASRSGLKKHIYKSQCKKYSDIACIDKPDDVNELNIDNKVV